MWGFYLKDAVAYPGGPVIGADMVSVDGTTEVLARAFGFEGVFDEEDGLDVGEPTPYGEEWGLPGAGPTPLEQEGLARPRVGDWFVAPAPGWDRVEVPVGVQVVMLPVPLAARLCQLRCYCQI